MGPAPEIKFAGHSLWGGFSEDLRLVDPGEEMAFKWLFGRKAVFILLPLVLDSNRQCVFWSITVWHDKKPDALPRGDELKKFLREKAAEFPKLLRDELERTPADSLSRWDIADLERSPKAARRWGSGRVSLIGDAAHAIQPWLGQGGSLSIEDAYDLAVRLASVPSVHPSVESALEKYDQVRVQRTSRFLTEARRNGNTLVHLPSYMVPVRRFMWRVMGWFPSLYHHLTSWIYEFNDPKVPLSQLRQNQQQNQQAESRKS